ncbi:MAG: YidC/Oxa1 family insertase periplasmic-domain containing protein [Kiritimatiellae bacterium]|nr:YidC/Oxa1 family insertase periplasmic-domain containing protein [Kiritimatiellia bacterium]
MNTKEKLLALFLGFCLVGWIFYSFQVDKRNRIVRQKAMQEAQAAAATNAPAILPVDTTLSAAPASAAPATATNAPAADSAPALAKPERPEECVELSDEDVTLSFSSWGGTLRSATLKRYAGKPGKISEENPPVTLGSTDEPFLRLYGLPGIAANASYYVKREGTNVVLFTATSASGLQVTRRFELLPGHRLAVKDVFTNTSAGPLSLSSNSVSLGALSRGESAQDLLSVDTLPVAEKPKVKFWGSDKQVGRFLVGGSASGFGCGGSSSAVGMPESTTVPVEEPQRWIALKSRFFLTALASTVPNAGFQFTAARDTARPNYFLKELSARMRFPEKGLNQGESFERDYTFFIGPKKLSLLQAFGNKLDDVMDFGMWSWFCKLLVPTLNGFYRVIPNYGIAIILLTFLVRLIFWPLTHKSTEGMKKMQEIQPIIKELQKKFKDNPQKLQQETFAVYREHKVNPLSSCLPMLIQIPVFIALFYVLRNSVELRYAPFLWIADLSEPENLFAKVLPIPLNILPILMAVTMALQSYLTPSAGDPRQQRMMMVMMPLMMLFMFYSFPAALSLYWTVSQILAIVQMWMIHRKGNKGGSGTGTAQDAPPLTRQQRRHA